MAMADEGIGANMRAQICCGLKDEPMRFSSAARVMFIPHFVNITMSNNKLCQNLI